ncbi:MAG: tetratricopeptide repeat protein [Verrucomicrobiota bacterium]
MAITLLGGVAAGEIGVLAWRGFSQKPGSSATVEHSAPPLSASTPEAPTVGTVEAQLVAAAVEKSLVAALPKPLPKPAPMPPRPVVTPESQAAGLMDLARSLRDQGDTGTAMTRLRQAQAILPNHAPVISEMALTYEKMGLTDKAIQQWRRIYEMGEKAGIYYAAADAKLRALQLPEATPEETPAPPAAGALPPDAAAEPGPALSLGNVGTTDDTGNTQPARRLKLRVPILARAGSHIQPRDVVIQVFFYEQLKDGSVVETNAAVTSSWARRMSPGGEVQPVDWSTPSAEVLEVDYAQPEFDPKDPRTRERRNYFGYSVRLYYKGVLNAKFADPVKLLSQFNPPAALPSTDLPQ